MRLHASARPRRLKLSTTVVTAAGFVLLVVALAAHFAGSTGPTLSSAHTKSVQYYPGDNPTPQEHRTNLSGIKASLLECSDRLSLSGLLQTSPLSPKLQQNVLSTFNTVPMPALEPVNPDQSAFVQGYKQLKPMLSATSYIPLNHKATQGIILPAGKALRLGSAYVALQLLRESLNCTLPVEIWHVAGEIDDGSKTVFEVSTGHQQRVHNNIVTLLRVCNFEVCQCSSTCAVATMYAT